MKKNAFSVQAEVLGNAPAGAGCRRLVLDAPEIASRSKPGQFVNLRVTRELDPLLARPFSVFCADPGKGRLEILYKAVGRGTEILTAVKPGERLPLVGPLGRGFSLAADAEVHVAIGGGTGMAPAYFLTSQADPAKNECFLLLGFREYSDPLAEGILSRSGASWRLASDAGEAGCHRGTVVDLLRSLLDGELAGRRAALYAAGPPMMLRGLAALAAERGLPCQASLEARMACGLSVCRGCVVRARDGRGGFANRAVCTYGPVFRAEEIDWDHYAGMD